MQAVLSELHSEMQQLEGESQQAMPGVPGTTGTTPPPSRPSSQLDLVGDEALQQGLSPLARAAIRRAQDRRSAIARCAAESLRLRVQSIDVRIAAKDLTLPMPGGGQVRQCCLISLVYCFSLFEHSLHFENRQNSHHQQQLIYFCSLLGICFFCTAPSKGVEHWAAAPCTYIYIYRIARKIFALECRFA
jgi:hypothetical protein